jgi:hypothetical protein
MQFKFVWLPLVILADVSSVYGSALDVVQARDLAIASDLTSREDVQCSWCGLCSYTSPVGSGLNSSFNQTASRHWRPRALHAPLRSSKVDAVSPSSL